MKEIDEKDLPEQYRIICGLIGKENTLILASKYQGLHIYLPKLDEALQKARDRKIRAEYNRYNLKELAIKYGLTEYWIRKILAQTESENQITLLDFINEG
jgi:Mor family transcriptional regulator